MRKEVRRFGPRLRDDFFRVHCDENESGWCYCSAWWVPTWEGWGERTAEENRRLREELLDRGEYDGYLIYVDGVPAGWCQAGRRDRLEKLTRQYGLDPDPDTWAITCFQIAPAYRRQGLATHLLREVLRDLRDRGVRRVEAFPFRDTDDPWTGPEEMFLAAGFGVVRDHPRQPVLAIEW